MAYARAIVAAAEVAGHALFQMPRLAHVEQRTGGVKKSINPRQARQGRHGVQQRFGERGWGVRVLGHGAALWHWAARKASDNPVP